MGSQTTHKAIAEYHEKYDHIPKDYMERLIMLYKSKRFTKQQLNDLMTKIDLLKDTEWNQVTYIFYMEPKSTPRPRVIPNTYRFYVSGAKDHKKIFDDFKECHSNMECVISTPCIMETKVYTKTPAGMSAEETLACELELIHNLNAPDWDNLGKTYSDMVQDTLISNDSIVCKGSVEKFYSIIPRIEVTVKFMKLYDCKYNKRTVEKRKSFQDNPKTLRDLEYII